MLQATESKAEIDQATLGRLLENSECSSYQQVAAQSFPSAFTFIHQQGIDSSIECKLDRVALSGIKFGKLRVRSGESVLRTSPAGSTPKREPESEPLASAIPDEPQAV